MKGRRLSACVVALRKRSPAQQKGKLLDFEVLLVQRSKEMKFASAMWVFPGGIHEAADGSVETLEAMAGALRTTALRETFEETGVFPSTAVGTGQPRGGADARRQWPEWRHKVRGDASQWHSFLSSGLAGDVAGGPALEPCCCFLTPEFEKQRSGRQYETHFFLAEAAPAGNDHPGAAVSVDESETKRHLWLDPGNCYPAVCPAMQYPSSTQHITDEALSQAREGTLRLMPPQLYILHGLGRQARGHKGPESAGTILQALQWHQAWPSGGGLALIMQPEPIMNDIGKFKALALPGKDMDIEIKLRHDIAKLDHHSISGAQSLKQTGSTQQQLPSQSKL
eukprot:gene2629-3319_t